MTNPFRIQDFLKIEKSVKERQLVFKTRAMKNTYEWINEWIVAVNIFFDIILAKTTGGRGKELTPPPFFQLSVYIYIYFQ